MFFWHALDIFLLVFHSALLGVNVLGWCIPRLRRLQVVTLSLTLLSWLGAGFWWGWGYCLLTDWHWAVRARLGDHRLPPSFLQWIPERLFGLEIPLIAADVTAVVGLLAGIVGAVWVRWRRH